MVMASLWDLVAQINGRRMLFWVCVGCLVLLMLGLVRHQVTEVKPFELIPDATEPTETRAVDAAPESTAVARNTPTSNPFASAFLAELLERAERQRREAERARRLAQEAPPVVVDTTPPPVQGPPRPEAKLLYRGMFTRPDGSVLGLVENQRSNRTSFHRTGDQIEGLTIGTISRENLELIRDDEVKVTLDVGTPSSFQPDK